MARPSRPWFRFYVEAVHDRKLRRLTPTQRWVWVAVLAAARQSPTPGFLLVAVGVPMRVDELADFAGVKVREVSAAVDEMLGLGMLDRNGLDGALVVTNWKERQFESDDVTLRTSKHRSKERSNDVPGNAPETETDTDTDTEQRESARKRAKQVPDDWQPSEATKAWVKEHYPVQAKLKTLNEFKDHAKSKGRLLKDIDAAFRNWCRKADEWNPPQEAKGPGRTYL